MNLKRTFEQILFRCFRWYGEFVARRPFFFFILPLLFSCAMTPAIFLITLEEDIILLFTPEKSPCRREQETFRQFSRMEAATVRNEARHLNQRNLARAPSKSKNYWWFTACMVYKNESNIMQQEAWRNMYDAISYVYTNFTCHSPASPGRTFRYMNDFCDPSVGCVRMDWYFEKVLEFLPGGKLSNDSSIRLTYPLMEILGKKINWGEFVFAGSVDNRTGLLADAKVVFVYLEFQFETNETMIKTAHDCMHQLELYFRQMSKIGDIEFYPLYENMIKEELYKTKYYTLPYLAGTILLVTAFSVFSSMDTGNAVCGGINALIGVWTIGLALAGSFGFMFVCGLYFNVMITVTPFITMCVGIDNDFLMAAAWRLTDRKQPVHVRLGQAFAEVCPSLTITSFTDILCFAIGIMIDTPAVSKFCLFTAVTLVFRYIYQLTFFASVMAYGGYIEASRLTLNRNVVVNIINLFLYHDPNYGLKHKSSSSSSVDVMRRRSPPEDRIVSPSEDNIIDGTTREHFIHRFFRLYWARFIYNRIVRVLALSLFFLYLSLSFYHALQIQVNIQIRKLLVDDSPMLSGLKVGEKYIFSNVVIGHVIVLRPPDFRLESNRNMMNSFITALENTTYSTGSSTSTVWFRDYLNYLDFIEPYDPASSTEGEIYNYQKSFYSQLSGFLMTDSFSKYISDLRFKTDLNQTQLDNGQPNIEKFKFRVYFENARTWSDHIDLLLIWRRICAQYPQLDAIVFDHTNLNPYYDQWLNLAPTCLQTSSIAVLCISLVTLLFMPDIRSTFFITVSFVSMYIGVVGFLQMWGADLDPITMACTLMTIGFSVYYTARVCYCYQCADKRLEPFEKLSNTMGCIGWPVLQGGIATFLGIVPLVFVRSYMVRLFFKSVSLVVWFGLLHGLLFMPVIMCCLDDSAKRLRKEKMKTMALENSKNNNKI